MSSIVRQFGTENTVADRWQLERLDADLMRGWCIDGAPMRAFGGQVAAQALAAAGLDIDPDRPVNSLHAYFVRPGNTAMPIVYRVERTRDGRSFSTRRVIAMQAGIAILILEASFHVPEDGTDHAPVAPAVPGPDDPPRSANGRPPADLDAEAAWLVQQSEKFRFELRFFDHPTTLRARRGEVADGQRFWFRSRDQLADNHLEHACALAYASDLYLLSTALAVHGLSIRLGGFRASSLDHAIWFHRLCRVDEWLLYEQSSPTSAAGRTLSAGRVFDTAGRLVATVMQEGLVRQTGARHHTPANPTP